MLVKMIQTAVGSNDGLTSKKYLSGNIYNLSSGLFKCFIAMGVCVEETQNTQVTGEGKMISERDLLNKSMQELHNKDAADLIQNKDQTEIKEIDQTENKDIEQTEKTEKKSKKDK